MRNKILLGIAAFIVTISLTVVSHSSASAINTAAFNPGRIIDDALFYDPGGMGSGNQGVANIQSFLDAHVPSCDTSGSRPSGYGNLSNAQYAQQIKGWPGPPYVCLNNYHENPSTGETSYEKGGGSFEGGISAARIIYNAAQDNRINPKVLLVLLRKESLNLFSDSWPMKSQYKYAMGYACPDSGPGYSANCDTSKAGFLKQVNYAAWQLRYYYDHMGSYNYAPGRWNTIQYSPDPNCGTKSVYIENYATASLYIYTPYTPNNAALNAYPGTASCGAYGNRNFWFFWQEWFGSTLVNGNFLRTENDSTVYLVGDGIKYPVSDASIIDAASVLGGVGFVSESYINSIPSGPLMGRTILAPDGTIYFYDANIKLPFSSCGMVSAYGGSCGTPARLTQAQINSFSNGPFVTSGMKTTSGKTFYMESGTKREVLDDQSLSESGLATDFNVLNDSAFNSLPYGNPMIRSGVVIQSRQDESKQLISEGATTYVLQKDQQTDKSFSSLGKGKLDQQSMLKIPVSQNVIKGFISDQSGRSFALTRDGKKQITSPASFGVSMPQLSTSTANKLVGSGMLTDPSLVKSISDGTVYVIVEGQKRPLITMDDLKSITNQDSPYIAWMTDSVVASIPTGNIIVGAGRLVKTPTSGTVYMTDGYDKLIPLSSFGPAQDVGSHPTIRNINDDILAKYTVEGSVLSAYVTCGSINYIGLGGELYPITITGQQPRILQAQTCNVLTKKSSLPAFLKGQDGTIYQLKDAKVHPISSWSTYQSLSGANSTIVSVSASTLNLLPRGNTL